MTSDWFVLHTGSGYYIGRDETGNLVPDVIFSQAAGFATADRAVQAQAYAAFRYPGRLITVHVVDASVFGPLVSDDGEQAAR